MLRKQKNIQNKDHWRIKAAKYENLFRSESEKGKRKTQAFHWQTLPCMESTRY